LSKLLPGGWNKTRVCNSQDPSEAEAMGFCRPSPLGYTEVRLASGNWEAINLGAWIVQILLSELLGVPTSIESGSPDINLNFYDVNNGFDIGNAGVSFEMTELEVAAREKDCRGVTTEVANPEDYEGCMHVNQEAYWSWYDADLIDEFKSYIEPIRELGIMTENAWFIPKFAAVNDPSLVSYAGLSGQQNRRKLAETFKTPTRWKHYCDDFSLSKCADADEFAERPPENEAEEQSFFSEGAFKGYFQYTEESNCDKYPMNCTGHFVDVPCEWVTYAPAQLFHNDISLSTKRYTYVEQTEIYRAASATKSAVIYQAYSVDYIYAEFIRTDSEFTRVLLPPPTQACLDNRNMHLCETTEFQEIVGDPLGGCDTSQEMLKKVVSQGFREMAYSLEDPEEFWSPALQAFEKYQLTMPQVGQIYNIWNERTSDTWNYDPRDAVCQFIVENFDLIQSFVPETYPRAIQEATSTTDGLSEAAVAVGCLAAVAVVASMVVTYLKRKNAMIYHTQIEFMYLVLLGMLLVSVGAITMAATPSDETCSFISWLTNLGFALQLTPLLLRASAINKLTSSGKGMQRIRMRVFSLYGIVSLVVAAVAGFLLIWFILDRPEQAFEYDLTNMMTSNGETVINAYAYCGSDEDFWYLITFAWIASLLVPACMFAFIASRVKEDMNDTGSLSLALYSHATVFGAWLTAFLLLRDSGMPDFMKIGSFLLSADTLLTLGLYFVPKFLHSGNNMDKEILPDVFVHTTVALLDIQGFTAWSSVREPVQVFMFLEQLFMEFDKVCKRIELIESCCTVELLLTEYP
jgi:hypothetical protein